MSLLSFIKDAGEKLHVAKLTDRNKIYPGQKLRIPKLT